MNNYHSQKVGYINRWISPGIRRAIDAHPVIVITGARQVGKSTFLKNDTIFASWRYYSLDNFDTLSRAERDPESLCAEGGRIIIDEAQKSPRLLSEIKRSVDETNRKNKFILSGSANFLLMRKVSESLAGRAVYFILSSMAFKEMQGEKPSGALERLLNGDFPREGTAIAALPGIDGKGFLIKGFMPPTINLKNTGEITSWWEGYVATYLERDLRELSHIESLSDFRRFMQILSLRTGSLLNKSEAARDAAIKQPTAHRYVNLLEVSNILELVPPYFANRSKRIIKSPKIFWMDPALQVFLAGYFDEKSLAASRELGHFFEGLIYHHLKVMADIMVPKAKIYHWRTVSGQEIDFVVEHGRRLLAIEVKMSDRVHDQDTENLRYFLKLNPRASGGIIAYSGKDVIKLDRHITAVPWHVLANG